MQKEKKFMLDYFREMIIMIIFLENKVGRSSSMQFYSELIKAVRGNNARKTTLPRQLS